MTVDFENEAQLASETVTRPSSNPNIALGAVAVALTTLVLGLMWYTQSRKAGRLQNVAEESFQTARLQPGIEFNRATVKPEDARFVIPAAPPTAPAAPGSVTVGAPPNAPAVQAAQADDGEARRLAELERLRKEAQAKIEARLRSPMLVVNDREGQASVDPAALVKEEDKEDDPRRRFLRNAEDQVRVSRDHKIKRIDSLVPQGFFIRGVLETAIQSDLPGNVRATTTEDVYSFDGRRVLIPKGTMLTGEYQSGLSRGQSRVFVVWTRMLRADGVSLMLGSYGTDSLGRSGLTGEVDKHFLDRFGSAALLTITGGVASFVSQLGNNQNSTTAGQSFAFDPTTGTLIPVTGGINQFAQNSRAIAAQTVSQGVQRMAEEALRDEIHIPPTIYVEQGTRIIVFVKRDLDFSDLYTDPVKEALNELKHPNRRARREGDSALGYPADFLPQSGGTNPRLVTKP